MDAAALIGILSKLSPTGLVAVLCLCLMGGLGYIIYLLVQQNRTAETSMAALRTNDLHELPEIANTLRRMEHQQTAAAAATLGQLADIRESLAYIKARIERRSDI